MQRHTAEVPAPEHGAASVCVAELQSVQLGGEPATQSTTALLLVSRYAVPVALQKPDLQAHAVMSEPPGEPFEFAGQAVQEPVWPAEAYVPVPHAVHELEDATEDDCQ